MSDILRVSNSCLENAQCSTRLTLSNVLRLTTKGENNAAYLGSCVHRVLAEYFGGMGIGDCMGLFRTEYEEYARGNVTQDNDRLRYDNCRRVLSAYLETHPINEYPFTIIPERLEFEIGREEDPIFLDEEETITLHCVIDALTFNPSVGQWGVLDHKTTGWMNRMQERQWSMSSQFTGYSWAIRKRYGLDYYPQVMINCIEFKDLPNSSKKCKEHNVPYSECGKYHGKSQLIGPMVKGDAQVENWRRNAITLSKKYLHLKESVEDISQIGEFDVPMEGIFFNTCSAYGGCEFGDWCRMGRPVKGINLKEMFVRREK